MVGPSTGPIQVGPTTTGPVQVGSTTTGGWSKSSVHRRELSAGATDKLRKHATLSCEQAADTLRKHSGANHNGEHQLNSHFQKAFDVQMHENRFHRALSTNTRN